MTKCEVCITGYREERFIRYHLTIEDQLVIVENVPAVVCGNCGETSFAPETVSRLQETVWERPTPVSRR